MSQAGSSDAVHYYFFSDWKKDWWIHHALAKHPPYACFTRKGNIARQVAEGDVVWQLTRNPKDRQPYIAGRLVTVRALEHSPGMEQFDERYKDYGYKIECCCEKSRYFELVPVSESILSLLESWRQTQKQMCRIRGYFAEIVIEGLESALHNPLYPARPLRRHTVQER